MRRITAALIIFTLAGGTCLAQQNSRQAGSLSTLPQNSRAVANYASPLIFEANQGQTDPQVKFICHASRYRAFLTASAMVLSLRATEAGKVQSGMATPGAQLSEKITVQLQLVGAASNPMIIGEDPLPGRVNYFIGRDPSKWHTNILTYSRVRYKNVYPGIDLVYYGNHRQLEYDFEVSPGADLNNIQLQITGPGRSEVDANGNLVLDTTIGQLHFQTPSVYQELNGNRVPLSGAYVMSDTTHVRFRVASYDQSKPLVIDPVLVYSTYLGGSGDDEPSGIAVDNAGNVYVAGYTDSTDFPSADLGSLPSGDTHVFIAKLDAAGSNLVYADYLGGNSQDYGYALVLDANNDVYVTGSTASSDFPLVNPYQGTYPGSFNAFLSKISADGSSLLYSTYLGGNGSDIPAAITIDSSGSVLVAGNTSSTNFPVAAAYQPTASPNQGGNFGNYGFLSKFSPDGSYLAYSTYLGGSSNVAYNCSGTPCWSSPFSAINGIAVDSEGNAYAGGVTNTYNFPTTTNAYQPTASTQQTNPTVGFVSKFSSSGTLDYSTYFYESSASLTEADAIAVDSSGSAYITGIAFSDGTFPVTSTSICDPTVSGFACDYAFVTKFDPTGSTLAYSTFLGLNNNAIPRALTLDAKNDAYVLASTSSNSFAIVNGIEPYSGGNDLLLVEIDPAASTQIVATYLGGSENEYSAGIALDPNGNVYVAGSTDSTDLPVTQGASQALLAGSTNAFVMKIALGSAPSVSLTPVSLRYAAENVGSSSQPQTVLLRNMGSAALGISAITPSGDFTESDTCGSTVAAADSCIISVIFTATAAGTRSGSIAIEDSASGSPHTIALSGAGNGPLGVLAPQSLTFSIQSLGTTSAAQAVTLNNAGNETLDVSNIQVTGDFAQVNNCPSTLASSSSCTINVTFTPTAFGARSGSLAVSDNAQSSPQTVNLTGSGPVPPAPVLAVSPASLVFSSQPLKSFSTSKVVTLSNTGTAPLSISTIQISGDFAQVNNCPSSLATNSSCAINIVFTPTAVGARSGNLTIADNAQNSPQVVNIAGTGGDFSLASLPGSNTVEPGAAAIYKLTISSVGGSFPSVVQMSCNGLPAQTSCTFSPAAVTVGANGASSTLTIATTATVAGATLPSSDRSPIYAVWIQLQLIGLFGVIVITSKRRNKNSRRVVLAAFLTIALIFMIGCAGGTGIAPTTQPTTPQPGTAAGTYAVAVTATSGNLQHSLSVTLIVQ